MVRAAVLTAAGESPRPRELDPPTRRQGQARAPVAATDVRHSDRSPARGALHGTA